MLPLWMQRGLLSLKIGNHLVGTLNRQLIANRPLYLAKPFNGLVDLNTLLAHGSTDEKRPELGEKRPGSGLSFRASQRKPEQRPLAARLSFAMDVRGLWHPPT